MKSVLEVAPFVAVEDQIDVRIDLQYLTLW